MSSRPNHAARSWTRALVLGVLALLAGSAAPQVARAAGCVHDGLRRSWQLEGVAHFDALMATGALDVPAGVLVSEEARTEPPAPKPVCDGPMCSSHQGVPTAPPVLSLMVEPSLWAALTVRPGLAPADSTFLDAADDRPRPSPAAGSVFHPPRA